MSQDFSLHFWHANWRILYKWGRAFRALITSHLANRRLASKLHRCRVCSLPAEDRFNCPLLDLKMSCLLVDSETTVFQVQVQVAASMRSTLGPLNVVLVHVHQWWKSLTGVYSVTAVHGHAVSGKQRRQFMLTPIFVLYELFILTKM